MSICGLLGASKVMTDKKIESQKQRLGCDDGLESVFLILGKVPFLLIGRECYKEQSNEHGGSNAPKKCLRKESEIDSEITSLVSCFICNKMIEGVAAIGIMV